jgi:hypothetical protein
VYDISIGEVDADSVGIVELGDGREAARREDALQRLTGCFTGFLKTLDHPAALFARIVLQ